MKAVIQRVFAASVVADGKPAGKGEQGLLVLLGVVKGDTENEATLLAEKIAKLRIFCDDDGKMNRSVCDIGESCDNHMIAFAAEESRLSGKVVDMDEFSSRF